MMNECLPLHYTFLSSESNRKLKLHQRKYYIFLFKVSKTVPNKNYKVTENSSKFKLQAHPNDVKVSRSLAIMLPGLLLCFSRPCENKVLLNQYLVSLSSSDNGDPINMPPRHLPTNKLQVLSKSTSHSQECSAKSLGVGVFASKNKESNSMAVLQKII
jgi:hypothetical protein